MNKILKKYYICPECDLCDLESKENLLDASNDVTFSLNDGIMGDGEDLSKRREDSYDDEEW